MIGPSGILEKKALSENKVQEWHMKDRNRWASVQCPSCSCRTWDIVKTCLQHLVFLGGHSMLLNFGVKREPVFLCVYKALASMDLCSMTFDHFLEPALLYHTFLLGTCHVGTYIWGSILSYDTPCFWGPRWYFTVLFMTNLCTYDILISCLHVLRQHKNVPKTKLNVTECEILRHIF